MPKSKKVVPDPKIRIRKRDLVLTFIVFFSIFGFIGYLHGRSVRNSSGRLRWDILARLELAEVKGQKVILYRCNGSQSVMWNVDSDDLSSALPSARPDTDTVWPTIFQNDALMSAFLTGGGVASVFTARELLGFATSGASSSRFTNEEHLKLIATAVLGAVSGYEVGYQIALRAHSDCADDRFNGILNSKPSWQGDDRGWQGLERTYFLLCLGQLEKETPSGFCQSPDPSVKAAEENTFSIALSEFKDFMRSATLIDHNIVGKDFDRLLMYRNILREYNTRCATQQIKSN